MTDAKPWFLDLAPHERSTLVATFGGWALDGMDVMVYSFAIPSLIALWHISKGQAGILAGQCRARVDCALLATFVHGCWVRSSALCARFFARPLKMIAWIG